MPMASNPVGTMNNIVAESAKAVSAEEDGSGSVSAAAQPADTRRQQPSNEDISDYSDKELKALLDEAITYKNPKDRAHKSETFKELLKRAETEEQSLESSFVCIPFTSSGGGSLQNIYESVNSEPRKFSSAGSANPRRHHISGHGYGRHSQSHYHGRGAGTAAGGGVVSGAGGGIGVTGSGGSGGGGHHNHHHHHQGHHSNHRGQGTSGFVSSRQGEGGSLPSNVNIRSAEVHPFIAEMAAAPRRRGQKNNSESSRMSDEFEMGLMVNGGETAMSKAAARSVAARGTSLGLDTDIPYAQMDNMSVIINMGDSGAEDLSDEQLVTSQAKKVTSHEVMAGIGRPLMDGHVSEGTIDLTKYRNITSLPTTRLIPRASILILQQQQQQQHYRTNFKIDIEHGATEQERNGIGGGGAGSTTMGAYEKLSSVSSYVGAGNASAGSGAGGSRSDVAPSSYEHVDKSIKLSLEPKGGALDPLANAYMSVKNGRGDQKSEMIIVTPSSVAQSDREMSSDLEWTRSMSMVQQKRILKNRRKYERNMTTIVSDEIIGFRGEEMDLDRLVQFIESKENEQQQQQQTGKSQQNQQQQQQGKGKNKGTNKKDQQQGGKLKKSNSMNELRSCSKLDEITHAEKEANSGVVLRSKTTKNSNKSTATQNDAKGQNSSASSSDVKPVTNSKRGDRRSWGTEELQYLGDTDVAGGDSFIVDTNNNMSGLKKSNSSSSSNNKKQVPDKSSELSIPTKTLGELPVNSVSMESLVSSSWANEEFHVVTKKRKSKKKQSIAIQPFEVERRTFNQQSSAAKVGGRAANPTTAVAIEPLLGSQKSARNRPNNLIASITNTTSSSSNGGGSGGSSNRASTGAASSVPANNRASLHPASQSKSRRKSTSSVPPSDHSDCSDLDSVHSLPIESPSTTKSKASKASAKSKAKQAAGSANGNGSQGISYADITKTANSQKASSPLQSKANSAVAVNGVTDDRDIKWPLIDGRHELAAKEEEGAAATEKPKWVNGDVGTDILAAAGRGADEKLQKMSDIIKSSQATVMRSTEVINVSAAAVVGDAVGGSGTKTLLQKSKSVDNESSGFNMNIDQYPSLEKTVNKKQQAAGVVGVVVTNNSGTGTSSAIKDSPVVVGAQSPPQSVVVVVANGAAGKKLKLLSSIVSDNNSGPAEHNVNRVSPVVDNSNHVAVSGVVSGPVLVNSNNGSQANNGPQQQQQQQHGEVTASREPVVLPAVTSTGDLNSKEKKMAVKTNNNLSTLSSVGIPVATTTAAAAAPIKDSPQPLPKGAVKGGAGVGGQSLKSNRARTNSMPQITPNAAAVTSSSSSSSPTAASQAARPAVIILNDSSSHESSDLTFGFDVNNQLLFGDFEEDEIRFLEPCTAGGSQDVVLMNDSVRNGDNINTSDYNSYNSSLCSSSSVRTITGLVPGASGLASAEGLVFDSNNHPNDEEELEVPPVSQQPQSTPKQASVNNCSNCSRSNAEGVVLAATAATVVTAIPEGMALMKNSCVQTSLDNLMIAAELNNNNAGKSNGRAVVLTVSDLESRQVAAALTNSSSAATSKTKKKKATSASSSTSTLPNWADATPSDVLVDSNGNADGEEKEGAGGDGEGADSLKMKLQKCALINAQFARQAPMGWMCNQMNSFFNNHEKVINFVGLAWEDLTHSKSSALQYYNGQ